VTLDGVNLMRTARRLASAGAAVVVVLGTLAVTAGPAAAVGGLLSNGVPYNDEPPAIAGTARYGETLNASTGIWFGTLPITYSFQWQHCDDDPCVDITGATAAAYPLVATDIGHRIGVVVTAHNPAGDVAASADPTDPVAGVPPTGPAPTIAGLARAGETLTATVGPWTGVGALTTTWTWARCAGIYACSEIAGATSPTYLVTTEDIGHLLVARLDVTSAGGSDGKPSDPTAEVIPAPAANGSSNVTATGDTITVSGSGFAPDSDVTVSLRSDPVTLGVAHTDAAGNFTATFAIPAGTAAGDHLLVFVGFDAAGNPITVEQAITLTRAGMLPVTGDDTVPFGFAGFALVLAGATSLRIARRRDPRS
jgi:hypothetical protein